MKPLLRWAGSKRKNLATLGSFWGKGHKRYIEPFAGSACLFFHLEPNVAVIGDLNHELIGTYQAIVDSPGKVWDKVSSWRNNAEQYYQIRSATPKSAVEKAARFLFLNRYCFNGIYRTNKSGAFNVPYGGTSSGRLPSLDELRAAADLLGRAKLVSTDFENTIASAGARDFVYLDPPYKTSSRRLFREYTGKDFHDSDLGRLKTALNNLHKAGASFVLSYADCPEAKILAEGYSTRRVVVRRNVAGFASHRRHAREVIVTNIVAQNET